MTTVNDRRKRGTEASRIRTMQGEDGMTRTIIASLGALCLGLGGALAQQGDVDAGRTEYLSACAGCHGRDGKGDGPMADLLKIETPDLTKLTERAGGTFPFRNTLLLIDGRNDIRAHGGEMPVWGDRYMTTMSRAQDELRPPRWPEDPEILVRGRLLSLVYYLESIQE
jgi:mono/diheme cytochrome c family protein